MMNRTTILIALLALALLWGAPARAADPPAAPAQGSETTPEQPDLATVLAAFAKVKTGLIDAVTAGEKEAGGGKAVDATFDPTGTSPVYRVTVYRNNTLWEGFFDADSGKSTGKTNNIAETELEDQEKKELSGITSAKNSMLDAIKAAEKEGGGKAIDAGIEEHDGKMWYQVAVVKSGAVQPILVDPATGQAKPAASDAPPSQKKQ
jgi:uncharacterized membrane protein YkoI